MDTPDRTMTVAFQRRQVFRTLKNKGDIRCGFEGVKTSHRENIIQNSYAFVYFLKGHGVYTDHCGRKHPFKAGSIMQRFPNKVHGTDYYNVSTCFLAVPSEVYHLFKMVKLVDDNSPVLEVGLKASYIKSFECIFEDLCDQPETQLAKSLVDMQQLILTLLMAGKRDDRGEILVEKTCELLSKNLRIRVNMPDIAKELNVGYSKLRKLFKRKTGLSMAEYRIQCRIEAAQSMLSTPGLFVSNVAMALGFPNVQNFSKQFKQYCGQSPREFQRIQGT
jgi:AraC-like DNA-binding protein